VVRHIEGRLTGCSETEARYAEGFSRPSGLSNPEFKPTVETAATLNVLRDGRQVGKVFRALSFKAGGIWSLATRLLQV